MKRETYYVQLDPAMMGLSDVKTGENTVQYEVKATPQEKEELKKRIDAVKHEDVNPSIIMERVHDERKEESSKNEMKKEMRDLFQKIYELGTPETKDFFKKWG